MDQFSSFRESIGTSQIVVEVKVVLSLLPAITPRFVSRAFIGGLAKQRCGPFIRQLDKATSIGHEWMMDRIRQCEDTSFGRDHGFHEIRSIEDYRKRVPCSGYEYFRPYIDRVASGNTSALIPSTERLLQFTITTGSTGIPKLNPVTETWLKQYRRAWDIWGLKLFADHPNKIGSKMLQMSGTWDMGTTPGGHQISMVSALLTKIQNPFLKPYYLIPNVVSDIPDPVARHYVALRLSILADVGWILLMNPGTLIRLAEIGDVHTDDLIRDIRDGRLTDIFEISKPIRQQLQPLLAKNPVGAQKLSDLAKQKGRLLPKDYWDEPVISCWMAGTAGQQSRYLQEYFGDSATRDMGLVSSEGRHTIPLSNELPAGVPSLGSGYYEFIPEENMHQECPETVDGHELIEGRNYRIVMSTAAGYFRFDIGDIVQCRGHMGQAPLLEFIQKSANVGDLEGEKLTEHQVVEASHLAAQKAGVELGLITAVPRRLENEQPRYDFLVENSDFRNPEQARQFMTGLDEELEKLNFLWRARRREGVLQTPHLVLLQDNEWERCIQEEVDRRGTGDYQYKHPGLVADESWLNQFRVQERLVAEG